MLVWWVLLKSMLLSPMIGYPPEHLVLIEGYDKCSIVQVLLTGAVATNGGSAFLTCVFVTDGWF